MSTVAERPRARRASAPPAPAVPIRHGKCSLHSVRSEARVTALPADHPAGRLQAGVVPMRKQSDTDSAVYQVAIARGQQPGCTCPDFTINGAICKHVGALRALGLIPGRKARPAAARRSHAPPCLAEPAEAPAPAPSAQLRRACVRHRVPVRRVGGDPPLGRAEVEPEPERVPLLAETRSTPPSAAIPTSRARRARRKGVPDEH